MACSGAVAALVGVGEGMRVGKLSQAGDGRTRMDSAGRPVTGMTHGLGAISSAMAMISRIRLTASSREGRMFFIALSLSPAQDMHELYRSDNDNDSAGDDTAQK